MQRSLPQIDIWLYMLLLYFLCPGPLSFQIWIGCTNSGRCRGCILNVAPHDLHCIVKYDGVFVYGYMIFIWSNFLRSWSEQSSDANGGEVTVVFLTQFDHILLC